MEVANQQTALAGERPSAASAEREYWSTLLGLADESIVEGRIADAGDHCKNALEIAREHGPGSDWLAESYIRLADVAAALDQSAAALRLYGQGVAILDRLSGSASPLLAHAVSNMGRLHMLNGEMRRALELAAAADALQRNMNAPPAAAVKLNLALVLATAGRDGDAEQAFKDSLAAADRSRPTIGDLIFAVHDNFAQFSIRRGRMADAEMALRSCLILRQESGGPRHPIYADGLVNLARLHLVAAAEDEAETLLWQASDVYRQHDGTAAATLFEALYLLGRIAQQAGRVADAARLCDQLLALADGYGKSGPAAKAAELHIRAQLGLDDGSDQAKEETMRRALGLAESLNGRYRRLGDDICRVLLNELAELLATVGKGAEAKRLLARAEELRKRPQWVVTGFVFTAA